LRRGSFSVIRSRASQSFPKDEKSDVPRLAFSCFALRSLVLNDNVSVRHAHEKNSSREDAKEVECFFLRLCVFA
jgi:hypothetical protein